MIPIGLILSKIKLQHILIFLVIGMFIVMSIMWNQITFHKGESLRKGQNYESLRDLDSLKVANLIFRTDTEMEDYIDSNTELKKLMDRQKDEYDGKIKKLTNIIYQKNIYIDNLEQSTDVSDMVDNIRNNISVTKKWTDSTECLVIKGQIIYDNNTLTNIVTERKFESDMILTGHLQKSQRNWWTRTFGRRKEAVATVTSNCGETKTIVINKQDK